MKPYSKSMCADECSMRFLRSLKERRRVYGLTQSMLAGCIGVSLGTLKAYEQGRLLPSLNALMRLVEYFEADLSDSINWKYYHGQLNPRKIYASLKRYGLNYAEVGRLIGYSDITVSASVRLQHKGSLTVLSQVLDVIEDERRRSKFRTNLLMKGRK